MTARLYRHTADPSRNLQLPGGDVVREGSTVRIDVESLPVWSAVHKWVRKGWLVPVDEEPAPEPEFDRKAVLEELYQHAVAVMTDALTPVAPLPESGNAPAPNISEDAPQETHANVSEHLASHTVAELRAMCTERGIPYTGLRKAELVEVLSHGE